MGVPGLRAGHPAVCLPDLQDRRGCGEVPGVVHAHLRLLRGGMHLHAPVHQHRHDDRADAGHRHPAAAAQLRRIVALGLHGAHFHFHLPLPAGEEVLLKILRIFALSAAPTAADNALVVKW